MKRILFIGEQSGGTMARPAFGYPKGAAIRLAGMLGMTHDEMLGRYEFINLMSPGTWDAKIARRAATTLIRYAHETPMRVVLLGSKVRVAFRFAAKASPPRVISLGGGCRFLVFPHPSGRNRLFNDPRFKARCQRVLRRFVREDYYRSSRKRRA